MPLSSSQLREGEICVPDLGIGDDEEFSGTDTTERRKAWTTIIIFLVIVTALSAVFHRAIVNLNPTSLDVRPLMWCPVLAVISWRKAQAKGL